MDSSRGERSCLSLPRLILLLSCFVAVAAVAVSVSLISSPSIEDACDTKLSVDPKDEDQSRLSAVFDAVQNLISRPRSCDDWVIKTRAFLRKRWSFSIPIPNLDFRGGKGEEDEGEVGSKEKVKGAAIKSLGASKSAIEDSAKSAAKFAEGAVDKTVGKIKSTLSRSEDGDHRKKQG